jgi:formylmethanofuran dehydrogenase subunit B
MEESGLGLPRGDFTGGTGSMNAEGVIKHVTCLGCGCGCDDVTVTVRHNTIVDAAPLCTLGRSWFGDGRVPAAVLSGGHTSTLEQALAAAVATLNPAKGRCLVYLGPDLSSQALRRALEIADILHATVDSDTSETAANGLLTVQRRGRAGATLGEIRNRGDVFLFWGIDPAERYPRFLERYSVDPVGTHVPGGRSGREVIGVTIGADRSSTGAALSLELEPDEEITALSLLRAAVAGAGGPESPLAARVRDIAGRLTHARYAVVVHDAEPTAEPRNVLRIEGLVALTQALNGPTRAALCSLRAGGNRVGAEAVLTSHTGYPFAVDYSRGYPRYQPGARGIARLQSGALQAALVVGSPPLTDTAGAALSSVPTVAIGPRASQAGFTTRVAVDTGVAGIHEGGVAYRMDEVPLELRAPLSAPRVTADVLATLSEALRTARARSA